MKLFPYGHATHPQWLMAAGLVLAQLRAQMSLPEYARSPRLALLYITDHYAGQAQAILDHLRQELPAVTDWVGTVGVGLAVNNAEYFDEPAMALMLCDLPPDQYRVFSGLAPLPASALADVALVHADPSTPELTELISEMAGRTQKGYLFGGLTSSRTRSVQFAVKDGQSLTDGGVLEGGLSGVAFAPGVGLLSRVTQGCQPVSLEREITEVDQQVVLKLNGVPALDVLLTDLDISLSEPQKAIAVVRTTLVGLSPAGQASAGRTGHLGGDVRVRHIVGLDPTRLGVVVAGNMQAGMRLTLCRRDVQSARADLMRVCAEIREELEPEMLSIEAINALSDDPVLTLPQTGKRIAGAVYVSCTGRGGPHFGGPSAEMQIIRHALGDVPLVGFFAAGEIAHNQLYGYTGVLTVFTTD
ncbi:FIST N-terminal domain-containing protein [Limnohabitans sp.]|jgi:small ligand-binding sensory domain FIST|uniref:FIST signal transduction protein n=1 Tax=Limnohabitans sp. TaxID=1907725 RepID=UPI0037BED874